MRACAHNKEHRETCVSELRGECRVAHPMYSDGVATVIRARVSAASFDSLNFHDGLDRYALLARAALQRRPRNKRTEMFAAAPLLGFRSFAYADVNGVKNRLLSQNPPPAVV
jgi:hypothetical protein